MIAINEIFYSIQGESSFVGLPTIFIRTSGCPLRCGYCDTTYAYYEGERLSINDILQKIAAYPCKRVCLTGGEPLTQKKLPELISTLLEKGYELSIETSGALDCSIIDHRVKKIIDVKTPDSGEGKNFHKNNLQYISDKKTEYKFVICSQDDFEWSLSFAAKHQMYKNSKILFSPSHEAVKPDWLAGKILESGKEIRLQLQLHKVIWPQTKKGV